MTERAGEGELGGAAIIWPSMSVCVRPRPDPGPSPPPPPRPPSPSSSSSLNYSISFPLVPSLNSVADPACPNATAAAASARAKERFHRAIVARARHAGRVGGGGEPGRGPRREARHADGGGIPHSHLAAGGRGMKSNPLCPRGRSALPTGRRVWLYGSIVGVSPPAVAPQFRPSISCISNFETAHLERALLPPALPPLRLLGSWEGRREERRSCCARVSAYVLGV